MTVLTSQCKTLVEVLFVCLYITCLDQSRPFSVTLLLRGYSSPDLVFDGEEQQTLSGCTYCSDLFKVADVAAHQEGRRSHEEVQHSSGQDGDVGLLPGQRLERGRGKTRESEKMSN